MSDIQELKKVFGGEFIGTAHTIKKKLAVLEHIQSTGRITQSVQNANWNLNQYYYHRKRDLSFRKAINEALEMAADILEDEAMHRATIGEATPVIYRGEVVMTPQDPSNPDSPLVPLEIRKKSDRLLEMLLRSRRPEQYKTDNATNIHVQNNTLNIVDENVIKQKLLDKFVTLEKSGGIRQASISPLSNTP